MNCDCFSLVDEAEDEAVDEAGLCVTSPPPIPPIPLIIRKLSNPDIAILLLLQLLVVEDEELPVEEERSDEEGSEEVVVLGRGVMVLVTGGFSLMFISS